MTGDTGQTPEGGVPLAGNDPHYFPDPILDCLTNMVLELAAQVWVNRERMLVLEEILSRDGIVTAEAVENFKPSAQQQAVLRIQRDQFIAGLMQQIERLANPTNAERE